MNLLTVTVAVSVVAEAVTVLTVVEVVVETVVGVDVATAKRQFAYVRQCRSGVLLTNYCFGGSLMTGGRAVMVSCVM